MQSSKISIKQLLHELSFSVSRSSGPGGQNVNKVNSKVTIKFDVLNSQVLTAEEKEVLLKKLSTKLTVDGVLILTAQESRSQLENKAAALLKFETLLTKAFEKRKARKPTKPSKGSVQKRIKSKKQHSEKKQWRQKLG
jgi:ribosome-associated protein